jgi:pimeloyl-ACP methyl ester carboxylesterase
LVLLAPVGGLPASSFDAQDWRPGWRTRRPTAPTWILDDATDLSERLSELRVDTLLVFGGKDPISPVPLGEFVRSKIASSTLRVVPDGTHDLEDEFPDLVASYIAQHLRGARS